VTIYTQPAAAAVQVDQATADLTMPMTVKSETAVQVQPVTF
jgi:hypothetical protein